MKYSKFGLRTDRKEVMFEIHVADANASISGTIPITWCFSRDSHEEFQTRYGFLDSDSRNVVVIIRPVVDGKMASTDAKEVRYVFPLDQGMAYISFKRPGTNRIFAYVDVNSSFSHVRMVANEFSWDAQTRYATNVFSDDGKLQGLFLHSNVKWQASLDVDVPEECFASEPADWEKTWLGWLVPDTRFKDECDFRSRRLFAYSLQVLIFLAHFASLVVVTLGSLLVGARGVSPKHVAHPLTYHLADALKDQFKGGTYFIRKKWYYGETGSALSFRMFSTELMYKGWPLLFSPLALICVGLAIWKPALVALPAIFAVVSALLISLWALSSVVAVIKGLFDGLFKHKPKNPAPETVDFLICDVGPRKPRPKSLKLRFQGIKAKVCKPFAG